MSVLNAVYDLALRSKQLNPETTGKTSDIRRWVVPRLSRILINCIRPNEDRLQQINGLLMPALSSGDLLVLSIDKVGTRQELKSTSYNDDDKYYSFFI